jgi:hypothetical protein
VDHNMNNIMGEIMGERVDPSSLEVREEVVRVIIENRPNGPAENSMILVQMTKSGEKRARYLSWIGYADLDDVCLAEPGVWRLIEPAKPYEAEISWFPFG